MNARKFAFAGQLHQLGITQVPMSSEGDVFSIFHFSL